MNWKEFSAEIIKAIAWPITVGLIIYLLRREIEKLLQRLLKFRHKDTEVEFSKVKDEIEKSEKQRNPELEKEREKLKNEMFSKYLEIFNQQELNAKETKLGEMVDELFNKSIKIDKKIKIKNIRNRVIESISILLNSEGKATPQKIKKLLEGEFSSHEVSVALFRLREEGKIKWEGPGTSLFEDEIIYLV